MFTGSLYYKFTNTMDWIGLDWIREWIEEKDMERLLMGMVTTMMVTTIMAVLVVCPWVFRPGFCCHIVPSLPFCSPALPSMTFPRKNNRELRLVLCFFLVLGCFFHNGSLRLDHWGSLGSSHRVPFSGFGSMILVFSITNVLGKVLGFKLWQIKKPVLYARKMPIVHIRRRGQSFLGCLNRSFCLPQDVKVKKMAIFGRSFWKSSPRLVCVDGKFYVKKGRKFANLPRKIYMSPLFTNSAKDRIGKRGEVNGSRGKVNGRQRVKFSKYQRKNQQRTPQGEGPGLLFFKIYIFFHVVFVCNVCLGGTFNWQQDPGHSGPIRRSRLVATSPRRPRPRPAAPSNPAPPPAAPPAAAAAHGRPRRRSGAKRPSAWPAWWSGWRRSKRRRRRRSKTEPPGWKKEDGGPRPSSKRRNGQRR